MASDEEVLKGIIGALRGGARIASSMTPAELSARSKKAAQSRKMKRTVAAAEHQRLKAIVQQHNPPKPVARFEGYDPLTAMPRYSRPASLNKYGAGVGSQYYLAVQRPKKRKRSSNPLMIDFDVQDAQDGMMDEHELNDLAKMAIMRSAIRKGIARRGGALIAEAMTPEERSMRSKKGWLKRQRAKAQAAGARAKVTVGVKTGVGVDNWTTETPLPDPKKIKTIAQVNTLLRGLAAMAADAKKKGIDAPNYDLCKVSIPGTNLFCGEHRGRARDEMPQVGGKPIPGTRAAKLPKNEHGDVDAAKEFIEHVKASGVGMTEKRVKSASLKASQSELVGPNVAGMWKSASAGEWDPGKQPIYISRDGYVLDGHHRWATVVGMDMEDGRLGDSTMNVIELDMDVDEALEFMDKFANDFGIKPKKAKTGDDSVGIAKRYLVPVFGSEITKHYVAAVSRARRRHAE